MDGLSEGWPWGRVCILRDTGEELVATLGAHVDARLKMVLENLASEEAAERHGADRTAAHSVPGTDLRPTPLPLRP